MNHRRFACSALSWTIAVLFCVAPAAAQNIGKTTGSIRGTLQDDTGAVLPGVTVTATSPNLVGSRTTVSGADGTYEFPALPTGTYKIETTLSGFAPSVVQNLDLKPGQTLKVDLSMKAGLTETVTVEGSSIIDVVSVEQSNDISAETFNELPKGRSWDTIVEIAPSVNIEDMNRSRGLSFQGASVNENVYIVDGVDSTETTFAQQAPDIVFEFLENIQVKSGFLGAEYGGALGGVVNMQTKSGSNTFKGGVNFMMSGSSLSEGPRQRLRVVPTDVTKFEYLTDPEDDSKTMDFGGFLGGPIKKDKVWFFAGFMPQNTNSSRTVTYPVGAGRPQPITINQEITGRRPFASAKLTFRASNALTLSTGYQYAPRKQEGVLPSYDLTDDPATRFSELGNSTNRSTYSFNADWVASPRIFVNAFAGYYKQRADILAEVGDRFRCVTGNNTIADVPANLQCLAGFQTSVNNNPTFKDWNDRYTFGATTSFSFRKGGQHSMKIGAQYALPKSTTDVGLTGERVDLHWGLSQIGIRGTYGFWRNITISNQGDVKSRNAAAFIQDQWTRGRFTFNLGLRAEHEVNKPLLAKTDNFTPDIVFDWKDKIAPRLGVAWDVKGDSSWRVYANAGYFYDTLKQTSTQLLFGSRQFRFDYYRLDTLNWRSLGKAAAAAAGAPFFVLDFGGGSVYVPGDTKPTRNDELSLGTDYQLGKNWAISAQYQRRALNNAIEDFNPVAPNAAGTLVASPLVVNGRSYSRVFTNPTNPILRQAFPAFPLAVPDFKRQYDGLTIELTRQMADHWAISFNYTLSQLYGNYEGLGDSDEQVLGGGNPNSGRYCSTPEGCYTANAQVDYGALTLDRPHQFKVNGSYMFDFGLTAGAFLRGYSGSPITPQIGVNQSAITHPEGRGSRGRTPFVTQADAFLQYGFKVGKRVRAVASANIINVFNQSETRGVFPGALQGASAVIAVPLASYFGVTGYDWEGTYAALPLANKDPRFLQPQLFQVPRSVRLGVRLDF